MAVLLGQLVSLAMFIASFTLFICSVEATGPDLSVSAEFPENQLSKDSGYFDLLVKPGEKQELKIKLKNMGEEDIDVMVAVNTATTSYTGSIDYRQKFNKETKDSSLLYPLSEILIPKEEKMTVPAGQEIPAVFDLTVPSERFEGILLGAVQITQLDDKKNEDTSKKESMVINNKYAYSIGVQLTEDKAPLPESKLDVVRVEASQQTGRNNVFAHLQHSTADIVEKVTYEGKVKKKNSDDILHSSKVTDYRIAPNSTYHFPISWENQRFEAGEYVLNLTVKSEESGAEWVFEEPFTISREEARELNEKAVDLGTDYKKWLIIGGITLLVVIIIVILLVISLSAQRKKQRAKKRNEKYKKKNKGKIEPRKKKPSRRGD